MIPHLEEIEVERIHRRDNQERKASRREVNVDMNPMVDLAFLLLTFFMLATTFSKPQAMELLVPAKAKEADVEKEMPVKESKTLSLVLLQNELFWYRGITEPETSRIPFQMADLMSILEEASLNTPDLVVLIKPLDTSEFEDLVLVLDALGNSDVDRYSLVEPTEFDKSLGE